MKTKKKHMEFLYLVESGERWESADIRRLFSSLKAARHSLGALRGYRRERVLNYAFYAKHETARRWVRIMPYLLED